MSEIIETTAQNVIPYPDAARQAAQDAIARYLAMLRAWTLTRRGVAGDGAGNVNVTGRANVVYARLGAADGEVCEAKNVTLVNMAEDDPILLARERPGSLGGWLVVDWYGTGVPNIAYCSDLLCVDFVELHEFATGANASHGGHSVAVRGHYAYCAVPSDIDSGTGLPLNHARLVTVDLETLTVTDELDLGDDLYWCNVRAARNAAAVYLVGSVGANPLTGGQNVYRFDVTTADTPSLDASAATDLNVEYMRLYESGTDAYLLGWFFDTGIDALSDGAYPICVDGATLTTSGARSDLYIGQDYPGAWSVTVGDTWIFPKPGAVYAADEGLYALDLSDVTTLANAWDETTTNAMAVIADLDGSTCLVVENDTTARYWNYTAGGSKTEIPAAPNGAPQNSAGVRTLGGVVYEVGAANNSSISNARAAAYTVDASAVRRVALVECDRDTRNTSVKQEESDSDADGTTGYLCSVGYCQSGCSLGHSSVVLNVMTVTV